MRPVTLVLYIDGHEVAEYDILHDYDLSLPADWLALIENIGKDRQFALEKFSREERDNG